METRECVCVRIRDILSHLYHPFLDQLVLNFFLKYQVVHFPRDLIRAFTLNRLVRRRNAYQRSTYANTMKQLHSEIKVQLPILQLQNYGLRPARL